MEKKLIANAMRASQHTLQLHWDSDRGGVYSFCMILPSFLIYYYCDLFYLGSSDRTTLPSSLTMVPPSRWACPLTPGQKLGLQEDSIVF